MLGVIIENLTCEQEQGLYKIVSPSTPPLSPPHAHCFTVQSHYHYIITMFGTRPFCFLRYTYTKKAGGFFPCILGIL